MGSKVWGGVWEVKSAILGRAWIRAVKIRILDGPLTLGEKFMLSHEKCILRFYKQNEKYGLHYCL